MTFLGMDVEQARDFGIVLEDSRRALESRAETARAAVDSTAGGDGWRGPDADRFMQQWQSVSSRWTELLDRFSALATSIANEADAQDETSEAGGEHGTTSGPWTGTPGPVAAGGGPSGGSLPATPFLPTDFFGEAGDFLGEYWENLKENVGIDGIDTSGGIISATHTFAAAMSKEFLKEAVPKAIPLIGDIFTGVMGGIDRWNDDEGAGYNGLERFGRAVFDGGLNFAGSFGGGLLGSAAGVGIAGLVGGGAGAAAGAPAAGVGAVPGAVAGGSAGAVVGSVVGDVVGGYFGATLTDSLADTILD